MLLAAIVISFLCPLFAEQSPAEVLEGNLATNDKRYNTFLNSMKLMKERNLKTIVETGTARNGNTNCSGDGCSTYLFSKWCSNNPGMTLDSVDISPEAVKQSAAATQEFPNTNVHCEDSVKFLREFKGPIDLLYLDSYDYEESNPNPSQRHHLKEIAVAYDKLHKDSVVMVDDCDLPHGGKCELVEILLRELGWKVHSKNYQLVMVRDESIQKDLKLGKLTNAAHLTGINSWITVFSIVAILLIL